MIARVLAGLAAVAVGSACALGAAGCGEKRNVGRTGTATAPPAITAPPAKTY
jgi:hypothetical protein